MSKLVAPLFAWLVIWSAGFPAAHADISLAKIFSDHMVLQRNSTVKIWGTADPGDKLVLSFDGQKISAVADTFGRWWTFVKTPDAGGPYEIEVSLADRDPKILISDVMIGEVWICSGQSNMEWPVSQSLNAETEMEQSKNFPNIRLFTVEKYATDQAINDFAKTTPWDCCSPDSVKNFSAVAYFFARELSKKLQMPIGLINTSWGGTPCEAWISRSAMNDVVELAPLLRHWDENKQAPNSPNRPGNLYNGMIAPLLGFKFRGVIWYQGEANVGRGQQYRILLSTLINSWRNELAGGEEFPFYFVQLAPYRYEGRTPEALPEVWEAQLKTAEKIPNTGMVVTTDIGDIKDIHPTNKQEVGRRLALLAAAQTYETEIPDEERVEHYLGPRFESLSIHNDQIRITFRNAKGGLVARNNEPLTCFQVCGEDRVFYPATAEIDGDVVIVSSPEVNEPIAVRFGWEDTAQPNLFDKQNLPASPFRTDGFDLQSKGVNF
jgi:sialate O-acetylesterase